MKSFVSNTVKGLVSLVAILVLNTGGLFAQYLGGEADGYASGASSPADFAELTSTSIVSFEGTHFAISAEESGKSLGTGVTESKIDAQPSSTTGFNEFTPIFFVLDISAPNADDNLNACITFSYNDSDLPEGMRENTLALFRSDDDGDTWEKVGGTVDTENNTVKFCGVDEFSQWTLGGKVPPPAVPLSNSGILLTTIALGLILFFGLRMKGLV